MLMRVVSFNLIKLISKIDLEIKIDIYKSSHTINIFAFFFLREIIFAYGALNRTIPTHRSTSGSRGLHLLIQNSSGRLHSHSRVIT